MKQKAGAFKMAKIYQNMMELIGETPILHAQRFAKHYAIQAKMLFKLESFNPGGSAKDRIALQMILAAEESGKLKPGGLIVEPTSGNTGVGLCAVAAARGYQAIITMPETMSVERRKLMLAYGAQLVLTDGAKGMAGAIEKAQEIAKEKDALFVGQFINPENPKAHYNTTGPEIWRDTEGDVDIFIAGVGTGGTITGAGRYLKENKPSLRIVAVEPVDSPVLSQGKAGKHGIQGIGAGFVPDTLDTKIYDEVITVTTQEAYDASRTLAKTEGILVGISSGAALAAAIQVAQRVENQDKTIVTILPDTGERYLSTPLYE